MMLVFISVGNLEGNINYYWKCLNDVKPGRVVHDSGGWADVQNDMDLTYKEHVF